jgi:DNA-directed RNA polymerase specialized sigma24 family protein
MAIDWWRARRGTRAITGKDLTTIEEAGGWVRGSRGLPAAPSEESLRTVIMESWPRLSSVEVDLVFMRYVHGETVVAAAARRNWSVGQTRKRIAVSQEKLKTEWGSNAN